MELAATLLRAHVHPTMLLCTCRQTKGDSRLGSDLTHYQRTLRGQVEHALCMLARSLPRNTHPQQERVLSYMPCLLRVIMHKLHIIISCSATASRARAQGYFWHPGQTNTDVFNCFCRHICFPRPPIRTTATMPLAFNAKATKPSSGSSTRHPPTKVSRGSLLVPQAAPALYVLLRQRGVRVRPGSTASAGRRSLPWLNRSSPHPSLPPPPAGARGCDKQLDKKVSGRVLVRDEGQSSAQDILTSVCLMMALEPRALRSSCP